MVQKRDISGPTLTLHHSEFSSLVLLSEIDLYQRSDQGYAAVTQSTALTKLTFSVVRYHLARLQLEVCFVFP